MTTKTDLELHADVALLLRHSFWERATTLAFILLCIASSVQRYTNGKRWTRRIEELTEYNLHLQSDLNHMHAMREKDLWKKVPQTETKHQPRKESKVK